MVIVGSPFSFMAENKDPVSAPVLLWAVAAWPVELDEIGKSVLGP